MFKFIKHLICLLTLTTPVLVFAQISTASPDSSAPSQLGPIVTNFLFWLCGGTAVLTLLFMPVSGIMYMVAGGDEDRVSQARVVFVSALTFFVLAVIGLIILNSLQRAVGA